MGMAELNSTQLDSDRFYFFAFSNSTRIEIGSSATLIRGVKLNTEATLLQGRALEDAFGTLSEPVIVVAPTANTFRRKHDAAASGHD